MRCKTIESARATQRGHGILLEMLKVLLVLCIIILVSQTLSAFVVLIIWGPENQTMATLGSFWGESLGILMLIGYCRFFEKRMTRSIGFEMKNFWKDYLQGLSLGFGMTMSIVIVGFALGGFRYVGINDSIDPIMVLLFMVGFMIQGMFEEVLCRGYILVSLARKNSVLIAIILNSLVFALLHIGNDGFGLIPCINLVLFGVFASVYFLKTDNIWAVSALHSVWNFSLGCVYGLSVSGMELMPTILKIEQTERTIINGGAFGPEGGVTVTIVLIVELVILIFPIIKKNI